MFRELWPLAFLVAPLSSLGCPSTPTGGGGAAGGDAGVDCPTGPVALLNLIIAGPSGHVPPDTSLVVSWSAGEEPAFCLDDPKTWMTLADANVVCDVDPGAPPPENLPELVCHLWTSGATHVEVRADGHAPYGATLKPKYSSICKGHVPTDVHVALAVQPDGGAGGAL